MGPGTGPKAPLVIEVDVENADKDLDVLDIEIPVLSPRVYREYKNLEELNPAKLSFQTVLYQEFSEEAQREIVFKDITTGEVTHTTILDSAGIGDYRSVIAYFARTIMQDLKLISGYDILYGKVKRFVRDDLFGQVVELESPNTLRNLSELGATSTVLNTLKKGINDLTVSDRGSAEIRDSITLRKTRPFVVKDQGYLLAKKSVFNRIIGDGDLELRFASFLENSADVVSFGKNYFAVSFKLDYVNSHGDISNYYPDFLVKLNDGRIVVVETKGREELDLPQKMQRLKQWCADVNGAQAQIRYDFVYVDEESFDTYKPKTFDSLLAGFREYKN
jgi:type III restriction enzyme